MGHGHHHHPTHTLEASYGKTFAIAAIINLLFVFTELAFGLYANSLALIADAWHNLSDVLGLLMAWGAYVISRRKPTNRFTYGFGSTSILAALFNALFLLIVTGGIAWEAMLRLVEPAEVSGSTVMVIAGLGIIVNGSTALMFAKSSKGDLNIKAAFLHLAADALISVAVVISGSIIIYTGWNLIDPLLTILISGIIIFSTWKILKEAVGYAMHAVPPNIKIEEVKSFLESQQGVEGVHDLHVWGMSTTETALSVHLVIPEGDSDKMIDEIAHELIHQFNINHSTIQVERQKRIHNCD